MQFSEFDLLQPAGQPPEFGLVSGEDFFLERFHLQGAPDADFLAEGLIPLDEGAGGDPDFFGDARQAPASGAEFEEPVAGFESMHHFRFRC